MKKTVQMKTRVKAEGELVRQIYHHAYGGLNPPQDDITGDIYDKLEAIMLHNYTTENRARLLADILTNSKYNLRTFKSEQLKNGSWRATAEIVRK